MNNVSSPSFIALRDPYTGGWDPEVDNPESVNLPEGTRQLVSTEQQNTVPQSSGRSLRTLQAVETLKPLANRFWWVPWLVIGIIGYRWAKEKF